MTTDLKAPREFSTEARDAMAGRGTAMPDGSFPIPDRDALRRAIASFGRAKDPEAVKRHIIKRARALGATDMLPSDWNVKAAVELKAEGLTSKELDAWLAGERSRRIVVVPFGGPLPGGKAGIDLDGEYFDEDTDLYGPYATLRNSRERLVDWHHDDFGVPPDKARMKGAILGHIVLDDGPSRLRADDGEEYEGVLADFWAKAGERRLALVRALQRRGVQLYGSSEAVKGAVRVADDGHIEVWPLVRHTITTSPQNTHAVVPALKALLTTDDLDLEAVGLVAVKAALVGLGALVSEADVALSDGHPALDAPQKAGRALSAANEAALRAFIEEWQATASKLAGFLDTLTKQELLP